MARNSRTGRFRPPFPLLAVCFAIGICVSAHAEVPADVQWALFSKIWHFDRSLSQSDELTVAVLYQSNYRASAEAKDELMTAARGQLKIRCTPVALDDPNRLEALLAGVVADVFYVTPLRGVDIASIARISARRHVKTVTATPEYVEAGLAVGLRVRNDRPDILINLAAARAEGSDLPAPLLKLSTIVGEHR